MSKVLEQKKAMRLRRKRRIRAKISGTAQCPRISVFRSNKHFYAQAIDDVRGVTLCNIDGVVEKVKPNIEGVTALAASFAGKLKAAGLTKAVYDRNGYLYHGVVAAFADALRANGIEI
jgi:large subunit ribosomal protein L18